jgi:hypothetical protein
MWPTSRSLTSSAFSVFIQYYFSLPWIREYLLDQRVYWIIHYKEAEGARENAVKDEDLGEIQLSMKKHRMQMHYDLMFLIRSAHKNGVTAERLHEIMKIVASLVYHRTLIARDRNYSAINTIFFRDAICLKIATTNEVVSSCWKKVARIPLKEQWNYRYFQEAKMEELKYLGYTFEPDIDVINTDSGNQTFTDWIETEYTFRAKLERMKSIQDQLKFYESLSVRAKSKGNFELCNRWDVVVAKEKEGHLCDYELLLAWSLERVGKKNSSADQIWELSSSFHHLFPAVISPGTPPIQLLDALRFTWETEKALSKLTKLENELVLTDCFHDNVTIIKEMFQDILNVIRSQLLAPFQSFSKLRDLTMLDLDCINETLDDLQSSWRVTSISLPAAMNCKSNLISSMEDFPDIVEFIETIFNNSFERFCKDCEMTKTDVQTAEGCWSVSTEILNRLLRYLKLFPFHSELILCSTKAKEGVTDSHLYLEMKRIILEVHTFISDKEFGTTMDLPMFKFGFDCFMDSSNTSILRKMIAVEYIKSCYYLLQQELTKSSPSLHCIPPIVLKIQELLKSNAFDGHSYPSHFAKVTLDFWVKGFDVLRKLPSAENDNYLQSLYSWIIMQLLQQKTIDPLLLKCISMYEVKDTVHRMIALIKYYLPKRHSLVDKAFSSVISGTNYNRLQISRKFFSSCFVPIDKFDTTSLLPFLVPVLKAFPKELPALLGKLFPREFPGLLGEWIHWVEISGSPSFTPFSHSNVVLYSFKNKLPHPYSEWDIAMICDSILNNGLLFYGRDISPKEKLSSKIKLKSRLFLSGSIEFLKAPGDKTLLCSNCLRVALLYLKFIEVNNRSSERQMNELERILSCLEQLINQHPRIKKTVIDA